jgi:hypothetical protein
MGLYKPILDPETGLRQLHDNAVAIYDGRVH